MIHAPVTDRKNKAESTNFATLTEHEQQNQAVNWSGQFSSTKNRNNLATFQQGYGNQGALRMLRAEKGRSPATIPVQGGILQRKCACGNISEAAGICAECQAKQEVSLQRKVEGAEAKTDVPSIVAEVLTSPGQPLDPEIRAVMEPRFRHSFSHVRIHTDTKASESAHAVNALAYTFKDNIVFSAGKYSPKSKDGQQLLAHELTHVVQQKRTESLSQTPTAIGSVSDAAETEADRNATRLETALPFDATALAAGAAFSIQRFHHDSSCTSSDLSSIVWPGDYTMRQMVAKAIRVLSATPINPLVTVLFSKYFMTATPPISTILGVFNAVQTVITGNDYTYECEHKCGSDRAASVRHRLRYIGINPNLHLCINHMSGYTLPCNASLILHEMTHYAAHLDDEATGCGACSTAGCPASLSPSDALDNTYSYADFAFELYPMPV